MDGHPGGAVRSESFSETFSPSNDVILSVDDLRTFFYTDDGVVKAADGVSFNVKRGEVVGIVGESGCGKTVTSLSIMRLILPPGKIVSGSITFNGTDLLSIPEKEMDSIRGNRLSMVFQQPITSLNPVMKIGDHITEVLKLHQKLNQREALERAAELLEIVGIPEPVNRLQAYPHEISGGQAQRVMIALALACNPELLIADEPTTALDVTIQAQILDLLRSLQAKSGTSIILITHDLGVIAEMVERVMVMYAGQVIEEAPVDELFANPLHPYTVGLLKSVPVIGRKSTRLAVIPGSVPNMINISSGCRFDPRCMAPRDSIRHLCEQVMPELREITPNHWVRCHLY